MPQICGASCWGNLVGRAALLFLGKTTMPTAKENRTLVIEGDLLRVQRTITEREVKTSDFIQEIARTQPLDTGPLSSGRRPHTYESRYSRK